MKGSGAIRRWIIDGDNLRHAWPTPAGAPLGRVALCEVLTALMRREGVRVTVVFDGPPPRPELERQMRHAGPHVIFSEARSADDAIETLIEQACSPAGLMVISSDHAVRAAARRRRASVMKSQDFVMMAMGGSRAPPPRSAPRSAGPDKPGQDPSPDASEWMREFGLDEQGPDELTEMMG